MTQNNDFEKSVKSMLDDLLNPDNSVTPFIILFLCLYVALVRPKLPKSVEKLFHNFFFRLLIISFILYKASNDMQTSILLTFAFLFIMQTINSQKVDECIENLKN
jgi:hypothetical protein